METFSRFHNLSENPFGETPNTRFFYFSEQHRAALSDLLWMIAQGKGFGILTGAVGTGKTLLCRAVLKNLREKANTALILQPILHGIDLLSTILQEFKVEVPGPESSKNQKGLLDALNDFLIGEASKGRKSIVLIDDAQRLPPDSLELIRLLSNIETEQKKLLQIIFVGQPELRATLDSPELLQLGQRLSVSPVLRPLDEKNTSGYISHRIEKAGGASFLRFHPKAVRRVFEETAGVPRLINKLCEAVLREAEGKQLHLIDASLVKAVVNKDRQNGRLLSFYKGSHP